MYEIERKWVIRPVGNVLAHAERSGHVHQGYLATGPTEVRIRRRDGSETNYLGIKLGRGLVRWEFEFAVSEVQATDCWQAVHTYVQKTRHVFGRFEVDEFHGTLTGLYLMECELTRADEPVPTFPYTNGPDRIEWGREVTGVLAYTNAELARLPEEAAATLLRAAYDG
jgi:CYTH domain-containing protein